jgi:hypothetical protein
VLAQKGKPNEVVMQMSRSGNLYTARMVHWRVGGLGSSLDSLFVARVKGVWLF